jgi:hypothetical protein
MNENCCILASLKRRIGSRRIASSGGCFESDLSVQRPFSLAIYEI